MKFIVLQVLLGMFLLITAGAISFAGNSTGELPVYTLEVGMKLALEKNEDIRKALKQLKYARGGLWIHKSDNLPQLSYTRDEDHTSSGANEAITDTVGIEQLLYRFGEEKVSEKEAFRQAERELINTMEEVIYKVRTTFYRMLISEKQIWERKSLLNEYREKFEREKARYQLGKIRKVDVLDVELQVTNEELMINNLERQLDYTKTKFMNLIGEERKDFLAKGEFKTEKFDLEKAIEKALERRTEIDNLEEDVRIQGQILREVFFKAGPDVTISGYMKPEHSNSDHEYYSINLTKNKEGISSGFGYTNYDLIEGSDSSDASENEWGINLSLSFPLFERSRIKGEREQALAELEILEIELEGKKNEITLEVKEAYNDLLNEKETLDLQRKQMELRKKRWDILQKLMEIGQASYYEIVQAQDDFRVQEEKYFKMEMDYMVTQENLKKSVGDYYPYIEKYYPEVLD